MGLVPRGKRLLLPTSLVGVVTLACSAAAPPAAQPTPLTGVNAVAADEPPPAPTLLAEPTGAAPTATRAEPIAVTTALAALPNPSPAPTATGETIRSASAPTLIAAVAGQLEAALNRGDAEAALALFEDDAQVKIPPDLYVGQTQIRPWLEYLVENHFSAEPGFRHTTGERATWSVEIRSDYLARLGLASLDGSTTLVLHDGKISAYTFVLSRDSAARHRAAQLAASQVLQDPVIVGLTSANVYGFDDVFRDQAGRIVNYRDVLTAEPGSGPFFDLGGQPIVVRSGF